MNLSEFSKINRSRCREWMGSSNTLEHHLLGLAGEVGELCNLVKKAGRIGHPGYTPLDPQAIADEVADIFIYLDLVAMHLGVDLPAAVVSKFNRTSEKYGFAHRVELPVTRSEDNKS